MRFSAKKKGNDQQHKLKNVTTFNTSSIDVYAVDNVNWEGNIVTSLVNIINVNVY